jgi:hypothetical protein
MHGFHAEAQKTRIECIWSRLQEMSRSLLAVFMGVMLYVRSLWFSLLCIVTVTLRILPLETFTPSSESKDKHGAVVHKNLELVR